MIVFAHAGHWAVQLIYLFPLAVLIGVILVGRAKDKREAAAEEADSAPPADRECD